MMDINKSKLILKRTSALSLQPDATAGLDALIYGNGITTNFATDTRVFIGHDGFGIVRELMKFDLSSIPAGARIISANLYLYLTAETSTLSRNVKVYRSLRAWVETQVTYRDWSTGNAWQTQGAFGVNDCEQTEIGILSLSDTEAINEFKQIQLNVAKIQEMITGGSFTNNGFLIKADVETNGAYTFASSDHATAAFRPKLVISYRT